VPRLATLSPSAGPQTPFLNSPLCNATVYNTDPFLRIRAASAFGGVARLFLGADQPHASVLVFRSDGTITACVNHTFGTDTTLSVQLGANEIQFAGLHSSS